MGKTYDVYNRELSLLQFNRRVLEEASNPDNPLLERGKFISICSSNLDEFFMVRVGSLVQSLLEGKNSRDPSGMTARQQLDKIYPAVRSLVSRQYDLLRHEYLPSLAQAGIHLLEPRDLNGEQKKWLSNFFNEQVQPLLTPRAIDHLSPFPLLAAKCLHLSLLLPPNNGRSGPVRMALIPLPTSLPRVTMLPMGQGKARGILLEDVVALFASRLFGGVKPLATGNYNDVTAKLYTDMGLFTCDDTIGRDAGAFFNMVTGYDETAPMEKLVAAPAHLRKKIKSLIKQETKIAEDGRPARIIAKMNSLVDPKIIRQLYKAADAGVEIDLIVRGICCLKTGGRDNLRVRSIVGRFLEHTRAFVFGNDGEPKVFLSSADWMPRNLDKRVELMFPVEKNDLKDRVIASLLDELRDNRKAWELKKSGKYRRVAREIPAMNSQEARIQRPAELIRAEDENGLLQ